MPMPRFLGKPTILGFFVGSCPRRARHLYRGRQPPQRFQRLSGPRVPEHNHRGVGHRLHRHGGVGRKRHIVTDTLGLLFGLVVHAADIQDRDGAPTVLKSIRHACPWLRHIFADGGYAGPKLRGALKRMGEWTLEIIRRSETVLSRRPDRASLHWRLVPSGRSGSITSDRACPWAGPRGRRFPRPRSRG